MRFSRPTNENDEVLNWVLLFVYFSVDCRNRLLVVNGKSSFVTVRIVLGHDSSKRLDVPAG
jgi:hypothetical protein